MLSFYVVTVVANFIKIVLTLRQVACGHLKLWQTSAGLLMSRLKVPTAVCSHIITFWMLNALMTVCSILQSYDSYLQVFAGNPVVGCNWFNNLFDECALCPCMCYVQKLPILSLKTYLLGQLVSKTADVRQSAVPCKSAELKKQENIGQERAGAGPTAHRNYLFARTSWISLRKPAFISAFWQKISIANNDCCKKDI